MRNRGATCRRHGAEGFRIIPMLRAAQRSGKATGGTVRRDSALKQRHWLVVAACVAIAVSPARLREGARERLLDLTARVRLGAPAARVETPATERERALAAKLALAVAEQA